MRTGAIAHKRSTINADALVCAAVVLVGVGLARRVVDNVDALNLHGKRCLGEVGWTAGPFNGSWCVCWISTSPNAETDAHRGLWEAGAACGVVEVQYADLGAIDGPDNGLRCPVKPVSVYCGLGTSNSGITAAVKGRVIAFAEIVCLHLGGVCASEFLQ